MYTVEFDIDVIEEDIPNLPKTVLLHAKKAINQRLVTDPISYGKPLRYSLKGSRRIRIGDYRIVYTINEKQKKVTITAIKHRKDIYDN